MIFRQLPLLGLFTLLFPTLCFAQDDDLLSLIDSEPETEFATSTFKSTRTIMTHSAEQLHEGVLDFRILHRFGLINSGFDNFFGLDQASMRMAFDYGISERLMVGIGRSGYKQELDAFVKYKWLRQQSGAKSVPLSASLALGSTWKTQASTLPENLDKYAYRFAYYAQMVVARKLNQKLSAQLSASYVHENLVESPNSPNDKLALGFSGRAKISNRVALMADYHYLVSELEDQLYNPLSIGVDIETGGHVFQLHFTNAIGMNERAYLTETRSNWLDGDFMFGFNLSRTFQVKKKNLKQW